MYIYCDKSNQHNICFPLFSIFKNKTFYEISFLLNLCFLKGFGKNRDGSVIWNMQLMQFLTVFNSK